MKFPRNISSKTIYYYYELFNAEDEIPSEILRRIEAGQTINGQLALPVLYRHNYDVDQINGRLLKRDK